MAALCKRMRVYIQDADTGALMDISGDVRGFEVRQNFLDVTSFGDRYRNFIPAQDSLELDLHLVGSGSWSVSPSLEILRDDWTCDFCGLPNKRDASYCGELHKHAKGCGAVRPVIGIKD